MTEPDEIAIYLQRLTPSARSNLLIELERLEACGAGMPGSATILEKLRAEFRESGQTHVRVANPSRYFFMPLEPLLVNGDSGHANSGRILRGSLAPIWQWITRDLLPAMARDYESEMKNSITTDNQPEARRIAGTFQAKVVKYLESTLGSRAGVDQTRIKLGTYTSSPSAYGDLIKMLSVLRARDALAKFNDALPAAIDKFDDARIAQMTELLNAFRKNNAEELAFALALVAARIKPFWHLILLPAKATASKNAADIAATPYAAAVSMVLDRLDDKRTAFRVALKNDRGLLAREILTEIYDTEDALRAHIHLIDPSDWGERLQNLMNAIAAMVKAEVSRFPDNVEHILSSRGPRGRQSLAGRLTSLAWKGRDAVSDGAAFCKKLVS
jgi:hypothetical protein